MKHVYALVLIICLLLLSACGAKEAENKKAKAAEQQPAASAPAEAAKIAAAAKNAAEESFSPEEVYKPGPDHPPYSATDGGSEWATAFGMARSRALWDDHELFDSYLKEHPESPLNAHYAGAYTGDANDFVFVIMLDEPENKALLDEIAGIGLKTDYQVRKNVGTKAYLEACLPEISRKLDEVRDRVKSGTASEEEKELINRYKPGQPAIDMDYGRICIEVVIKTPWYSIGENWGEADMYRDLDRCKELFYKFIGYEDVMTFGFGV